MYHRVNNYAERKLVSANGFAEREAASKYEELWQKPSAVIQVKEVHSKHVHGSLHVSYFLLVLV